MSTPVLGQLLKCKMRKLGLMTVDLYCPRGSLVGWGLGFSQAPYVMPFKSVLMDITPSKVRDGRIAL